MSDLPSSGMTWVRRFSEGSAAELELLGGKGGNLAELTRLGVPVPPGIIVTTEACRERLETGKLPEGLLEEIAIGIGDIGRDVGRRFGDPASPLLVSVRSGAPISMPGMMETILNVGLSRATLDGFASEVDEHSVAINCLQRLLSMYAAAVDGVELPVPEGSTFAELEAMEAEFQRKVGEPFPADPWQQLERSVDAVFCSWDSRRAKIYRRYHGIPATGTAVVVQAMVFGNAGRHSGTGVAFTRDPSTGEPEIFGDYLPNAQGEDVVAGSHNAAELSELGSSIPEAFRALTETAGKVERRFGDMCEIEFTVERGRLWTLQARKGQRSAAAAVRIAVDLADSGAIDREEAISRVSIEHLEQILHDRLDHGSLDKTSVLTTAIGASPGVAIGSISLHSSRATEMAGRGEAVILVRPETRPDDLDGILASAGLLTTRGGKTSHAAVVTRGLGKPCVCGAEEIAIDESGLGLKIGEASLGEGDRISIDGESGMVIAGEAPIQAAEPPTQLLTLLDWCDGVRELMVDAIVSSPEGAEKAVRSGADGIVFQSPEGLEAPVEQARSILARAEGRRVDVWLPGRAADGLAGLLEEVESVGVDSVIVEPDTAGDFAGASGSGRMGCLRTLASIAAAPEAGATDVLWTSDDSPDPASVRRLEADDVRAVPPDLAEESLEVATAVGASRILVPVDHIEIARLAAAKRQLTT